MCLNPDLKLISQTITCKIHASLLLDNLLFINIFSITVEHVSSGVYSMDMTVHYCVSGSSCN